MMTPETKKAMDTMLDIFGGADGGVGYAKFSAWVQNIDSKEFQSVADRELVLMVQRFGKLLRLIADA